MGVFKPVDTAINFPQSEAAILKFWKENKIFEKSLQQREGVKDSKHWVFYEGPPTANGKPHPGHVLTRVVKDLFPRYKTMCGYYVPRKAGWDTHGLPVEIEVEKELKLDGKSEVEKYGVEPFVRKCMDSVFRYTTDWEKLTEKIGFWIDLKDAYVTYHQSYVESVWWSLKELHERNLFYKGHKILPWCPHCQTALSQNEVALGYQEVEDPSVFVTFHVKYPQDIQLAKKFASTDTVSFLAWTTTPWTLPSNAALAINKSFMYSFVMVGNETLILASELVEKVLGKIKHEKIAELSGDKLSGIEYKPLFSDWPALSYNNWKWGGTLPGALPVSTWRTCFADFVTLDTGSGIVHIAPAFGADDYNLGRQFNLPTIQLVGPNGKFIEGCAKFSDRFCKEADSDLIRDLKERKLLLKRENYKHDYPFCWRCKSPLIYFARGGWFIRTTREIQHVIENNQCVDWHPEHIKDGRFGSFLGGNVDWALSRERYWGTPLNIWVCECGNQEAVGSFADLQKKPNAKGLDAFDIAKKKDPTLNDHLRVHKPWIDAATFSCSKCGKEMKRTPEVIDCWYDSGAMPFAQWGYPHAPGSKEKFNLAWPADFISEAIDQTRGWFYTLMAESTLLKDSFEKTSGLKKDYPVPFKTCVVLGHVCDELGKKLSKSNKEHQTPKYDPNSILDEEGADALRWFFYASNSPWNNMRFSRPTVREAQKEFLLKLRNVYSFFTIYANIDGFKPHSPAVTVFGANDLIPNLLDRWIASELHSTIKKVRAALDGYDIFSAASALNEFVEALSNWHVRRSRERFWAPWEQQVEMPIDEKNVAVRLTNRDFDKLSAYWTLYSCLVTLSQLTAPFIPFMAEDMWQNLVVNQLNDQPSSVHLSDYPEANEAMIDPALSAEVALVREIASLGRAARSSSKLKTRQPLAKVVVVLSDAAKDATVRKHEQVLLDELNVKKIEIAHQADQFVNYELKPNFKAIGSKFRESVPLIKEALSKADAASLRAQLAASGTCALALSNGKCVDLTPEEVEVSLKAKEGYAAASGKTVVVVLDTHLTPELLEEGVARELVNRVNGWRSELNLKYEQRIKLALKGSAKLEAVAKMFGEFVARETLAAEMKIGELPAGWKTLEIDVDGEKAVFAMETA